MILATSLLNLTSSLLLMLLIYFSVVSMLVCPRAFEIKAMG